MKKTKRRIRPGIILALCILGVGFTEGDSLMLGFICAALAWAGLWFNIRAEVR